MLSIISTVGTSVLYKSDIVRADIPDFEKNTSVADIADILSKSKFKGLHIYEQVLADLDAQKSRVNLRRYCAEINSIEGIHDENQSAINNRYYFLSSDTPKGALATRILVDYCKKHYAPTYCQPIRI